MDRIPLLVVYPKRIKAYLRSLASKLSGKARRKEALFRKREESEMGIRVCDVQKVVSHEGDTIRPHKPVWAIEKRR